MEACMDQAVQMRRIARDVARPYRLSAREADHMARSVWNWNWLPLSQVVAAGMLVINAAGENEPRQLCPVWYRTIDDGRRAALVAPSLGALVRQWIVALRTCELSSD